MSRAPADALAGLAELPGVGAAVDAARGACEELRWHEAFRRRWREVRAEAGLRAAAASAALDGAPVGVEVLRAWATGGGAPGGGVDAVAAGALRAQAVVEAQLPDLGARGGGVTTPLPQVLARVHAAAAAGLLPDTEVGRPRTGAPGDLRGLGPAPAPDVAAGRVAGVLRDAAGTRAPALVTVAVVHAELLTARPFAAANGVAARATARLLAARTGLDPTGTVLPEPVWQETPQAYQAAAARYATGEADAVAGWVVAYADAVVRGAARARAVADEVLAGRRAEGAG
ncbi:cell filamentation protein Fic [Cellulomonas wangsupingiae]|uniref:cell filamentation protein Fic n=1 Tax=Cellulomonas wangsupingiae TaxID=2968085 RepID=UPI002030D011|nr:cell filamentation protein Fic [Cellulomonas wangsupingiae]MCM0639973.1 cell filamentation protein Fic [Cellulomonas wangsupingiae]